MKKVFIGVGHGGSDPGAVSGKFKEDELNLSIAKHLRTALLRSGIKVGISRLKDENDRLVEEIRECNAFGPNLAVEIHNNAGGGYGHEVYYYPGDKTGKKAATRISKQLKAIGQEEHGGKGRGVKGNRYNLGWLNDTKATAVLCECGFIDTKDVRIMDTESERKVMGEAIAKGVCKHLGVKYVAQVAATKSSEKVKISKVYKTSAALTGKTPAIKTGYIRKVLAGSKNPYLIYDKKTGGSAIGWTRKKYISSK